MANMIVRDSFATLNGDKKVTIMPSGGLQIVGEDEMALFEISIKDNVLHISAGRVCKMKNGKMYDDRFVIKPVSSNCVDLIKLEYEP